MTGSSNAQTSAQEDLPQGAGADIVLSLSCPDRVGIVAAVAGFIASRGGLITEAAHFVDDYSQRSFMRTRFRSGPNQTLAALRSAFVDTAAPLDMAWDMVPADARCRVLVAVSKQGHCLNSLLHRWSIDALPIEITGVVSNHRDHERMVGWYGLPFFHLPVEKDTKAAQERALLGIFDDTESELLVLARYMQILSADACQRLAGRCINIHHSFLPGFKGARPYHQAYTRGVKIIGATAHYVTPDLDEGPIIEQGVERVDHTMGPKDLIEIGHDLESLVLNRAVRWHAEHRVFERLGRTVVLRS